MATNKNLLFIKQKIEQTEVALFHCLTNSILRVSNTVIKTLKVDDDGNIWFFITRPQQLISQFDHEFPVSLTYYKKGNTYKMHVSGTAQMLTNAEEIGAEVKLSQEEVSNALCTQLLIKVRIQSAEFRELSYGSHSMLQRLKTSILNLLHWAQPMERQFNFSSRNDVQYGF